MHNTPPVVRSDSNMKLYRAIDKMDNADSLFLFAHGDMYVAHYHPDHPWVDGMFDIDAYIECPLGVMESLMINPVKLWEVVCVQ